MGNASKAGNLREHPSAAPKGSQPRLAALGSPFQGKGLAWTLPPSYGRRCPEGAEVGWGKRYEKEWEMRLKPAIYENTRVSPQKEANPASLRSAAPSKGRGSRGHSLPPSYGRRCPEGAEVGWGKRYEKEREDRLKCVVYESTRAPIFLKSDARKQHGRHKSIKAPYP